MSETNLFELQRKRANVGLTKDFHDLQYQNKSKEKFTKTEKIAQNPKVVHPMENFFGNYFSLCAENTIFRKRETNTE